MYHPPFAPYLIREISPYMLKRVRRAVNWGHSPTFAKLNFFDIERELRGQNVNMARRKSAQSEGSSGSSRDTKQSVQWLNYKLTPEDVAIVLSDADNHAGIATRLSGLFASGADFSVRYVVERQNFSAFAIAVARSDGGVRIGISAFGGTVWQAIASVLYKCDLYASEPEKLAASGQGLGIG